MDTIFDHPLTLVEAPINLLTRAVMMSTPLFSGAIMEVFSECTGMMVCAIEGIFLMGAWDGFVGAYPSGIIGGRGWIAFAICFLGNWNPKGIVLGTLAFGLADAVAIYIQSMSGNTAFPSNWLLHCHISLPSC